MATVNKLKVVERRANVMKMRREGWSYEEIAEALGLKYQDVVSDVRTCLDRAVAETDITTEQERQLQAQRLDALLKAHLKFALDSHAEVRVDRLTGQEVIVYRPPDPAYAALILKVEERRAKLMALDMPEVKKLEVSGIREYIGLDMDKV